MSVGDTVTFSVTVTNTDPNILAPGVEVTDPIPPGFTFVSATPSKGTFDSATGIWDVGVVAAGSSETIQLTYQVAALPTNGNSITNTAEISDAHVTDPDSTENNGVTGEDDQASATVFDGDKDGDGILDVDDLDDDNDGILDTDEGFVPAVTAPINSTNLNSPGFPLNTDVSTGNTAQLNGLFSGLLDFEAELVGAGGGASTFVPAGDPDLTFFNEAQFSFGFGLQNNTNQPISNWAVEIANANYNLNQSQLTNNTAFNLVTTTNPDGTFNHLFVGTSTIPPFSGLNIEAPAINFGFNPTSSGITVGMLVGPAGGPNFAGGVQVQNDPTLGGDFIFVQPENLGDFPNEFAEYTFNFNNPVQNLSFVTSGINFGDTVIYEAFFQGVSVPITAANFSGFTDGVVTQNGNELFNAGGVGGTNVDENLGVLTIAQPVDQIIARAGKANGSDSTVTLGFTAFRGDIILAPEMSSDTDGDGVPNHCDLDSDNDGISDLQESGNALSILADANMDGTIDAAEAAAVGLTDANSDGVWDQLGTTPVDSDGDGVQDFLDLDSDNDGIPDVIESQPTGNYNPASGTDGDGDGIDDTFDTTPGHGGDFAPIEDTDGDGTPDYLDTDSDNDGTDDIIESGLTLSGNDNDGDGIDDAVGASFSDPDGIVNNPSTDLGNQTGDTTEVGYREFGDKDWDGIADDVDLDDDNDGILAVSYTHLTLPTKA